MIYRYVRTFETLFENIYNTILYILYKVHISFQLTNQEKNLFNDTFLHKT